MVGAMVFAGTGLRGSLTLVSYFFSSSLLGRLPRPSFTQHRGNRRDAVQVFANGGVPALLAAAHLHDSNSHHPARSIAFSSAVAAAAADTWATEIGGRFGKYPRSIVTGRHVQPGASGGISAEGLLAACTGAALIGLTALPAGARYDKGAPRFTAFLGITIGGLTGSVADSLFGATFQERRVCEQCSIVTEHLIHGCGSQTSLADGVAGWTNDVTNLAGICCGALVGVAASSLLDASTSRFTKSDSSNRHDVATP